MHNGEWSLISFTLLNQLGVGLVLGLGFVFFTQQSVYENLNSGFSLKSPELIILVLLVVATIISFLHLGSPQHFYNSMNNLKGSWISKEILMLVVFGFGMLLFMISKMLDWNSSSIQFFLVFSMISGLGLVFVMAGIYMIPTVPSWNHFNTPVSFLGSALILGSASMVVLLLYTNPGSLNHQILKHFSLFMLVSVCIVFISASIHFYQLSRFEFTGIEQLVFKKGWFLTLFLVRSVLIVLIILVLVFLIASTLNIDANFDKIKFVVTIVFILIVVEEMIGRYLFYSAYFRLGV